MRVAFKFNPSGDDRFHHHSFSFVLSRTEDISDVGMLASELEREVRPYGKHVSIRLVGKNPAIPPEIYIALVVAITKEIGSAAGKAILSTIKSRIDRFRKHHPAIKSKSRNERTTLTATHSTRPRKVAKKKAAKEKAR